MEKLKKGGGGRLTAFHFDLELSQLCCCAMGAFNGEAIPKEIALLLLRLA